MNMIRLDFEGIKVCVEVEKAQRYQIITSPTGMMLEFPGSRGSSKGPVRLRLEAPKIDGKPGKTEASVSASDLHTQTSSTSLPERAGMRLAGILRKRGLSVSGFARTCGVSGTLVRDIIIGKQRITKNTAERIGKALGMDPQEWLKFQAEDDKAHAKAAEVGAKTKG